MRKNKKDRELGEKRNRRGTTAVLGSKETIRYLVPVLRSPGIAGYHNKDKKYSSHERQQQHDGSERRSMENPEPGLKNTIRRITKYEHVRIMN